MYLIRVIYFIYENSPHFKVAKVIFLIGNKKEFLLKKNN